MENHLMLYQLVISEIKRRKCIKDYASHRASDLVQLKL